MPASTYGLTRYSRAAALYIGTYTAGIPPTCPMSTSSPPPPPLTPTPAATSIGTSRKRQIAPPTTQASSCPPARANAPLTPPIVPAPVLGALEMAGEVSDRAPCVAVVLGQLEVAQRRVADLVGGERPQLGRAEPDAHLAAAARAVDPQRLAVGALDGLEPRDQLDLGVGQAERPLHEAQLLAVLVEEDLDRAVAQQREPVLVVEVRELLRGHDQRHPEVARAAREVVRVAAQRRVREHRPELVAEHEAATGQQRRVGRGQHLAVLGEVALDGARDELEHSEDDRPQDRVRTAARVEHEQRRVGDVGRGLVGDVRVRAAPAELAQALGEVAQGE